MAQEQNFSEVKFLTVAEVAEVMRVSKMTVYRLVHAGDLPAVRFGKSYRVPESAVAAYLEQAVVDVPGSHPGHALGSTGGHAPGGAHSAGSAHTA
ncbi:helix-turn-helix domain-containing protein [Arthrobacter sp. 35W]|uniref:helix-turn-helix domain-containing protein n=1 Tax=Arthrobacter sp. 35W TaxID=1132441 RepID=UPI00040BEF2B